MNFNEYTPKGFRCLNLSCESNAFQGQKNSTLLFPVWNRLNLSCESNAFQGDMDSTLMKNMVEVLISLARVMLFRGKWQHIADICGGIGLNLSCESNAFQGSRYALQNHWHRGRLNLSCESNAFQGSYIEYVLQGNSVLISLARVMLFRGKTKHKFESFMILVLISLARVMLFRGNGCSVSPRSCTTVLISLARVMLFRAKKLSIFASRTKVLISLARVMLFRGWSDCHRRVWIDNCLNLSCESNAFQGVPLWNPHK